MFFSSLTTFHFFCAMCDGPGYLPLEWKPDNEKESQYLQFCDTCQVLPVLDFNFISTYRCLWFKSLSELFITPCKKFWKFVFLPKQNFFKRLLDFFSAACHLRQMGGKIQMFTTSCQVIITWAHKCHSLKLAMKG